MSNQNSFFVYFILSELSLLYILSVINKHYSSFQIRPESNLDSINYKQISHKYILVFIFARIIIWIKSPYIILNFLDLDYSIHQISLLYILDLMSASILSPILGNISDVHGRKYLCMLYYFLSILDLIMKYNGNEVLIIFSQIINGATTVIIHNSFESFINQESEREIKESKNRLNFLNRLFKNCFYYDSISSVISTIFSSMIYTFFSIRSTFLLSIAIGIIGLILFYNFYFKNDNEENTGHQNNNPVSLRKYIVSQFKSSIFLIIFFIEICSYTVLIVYLFIWIPVLIQKDSYDTVNIGLSFLCFTLSISIFTKLYECFIITLKLNIFLISSIIYTIQLFCIIFVYQIDSFSIRLFILSIINGSYGYIFPMISYIKSSFLNDKFRTTLMGIYKLPAYFLSSCIILLSFYLSLPILLLIVSLLNIFPIFICVFNYKSLNLFFIQKENNIMDNSDMISKQ